MDLPELITFQIDRKLIDRARMKSVPRRDGSVSEFYEFSMHKLREPKHGHDYIVKQSVTKEERAARVEMPILGNGKAWDFGKPKAAAATPTPPPDAGAQPQGDDVPF
jgi:hypothetical protein